MAALLYVIGGVSVCIIRYPTSNRRLRDRFSLSRSGCRVEYLGIGSKHLLTWATGREMRGGAAHNRDGEKQTNKSGRWGGTKGKKKCLLIAEQWIRCVPHLHTHLPDYSRLDDLGESTSYLGNSKKVKSFHDFSKVNSSFFSSFFSSFSKHLRRYIYIFSSVRDMGLAALNGAIKYDASASTHEWAHWFLING